ncbi:Mur ligase family protein [Aquibium microcysteis]|uniref:Mur ligase family protein n=1 Tax=Aquibium microcysteis TaxID=675281 RepID=UPI00165D011F|nr:Mur ligase family protein [Aquibium microcysteis]
MTRQQRYRGRTDGILATLVPRDAAVRRAIRFVRTKWRLPLANLLRRRARFDAVIGVTGSAGKSTTCRLVASVLAKADTVHLGVGINTPDGIRRRFLQAPSGARYWVQEISGHEHEAMRSSLAFVRPTLGVVTTIGMDHIAHHKSIEAIAEAKVQLVEVLPPDGIAILNADDPLVAAMAARTRARVITYGRREGADVRLVSRSSGYPRRLAMQLRVDGEDIQVPTRFVGARWETSVLAAMAAAHALGVDLQAAAAAIGAVEPEPFKDQVEVHAGVTYIVDALKAPYWTIASSIEILASAEAERKLMLFGTISDYRGTARTKYVTAAKEALAEAEIVIFYGPHAERVSRLKPTYPGRLFTFDDFNVLMAFLDETLRPGDLLSIKSSGADHLERVALDRSKPVACRLSDCRRLFSCGHCKHLYREPRRNVF